MPDRLTRNPRVSHPAADDPAANAQGRPTQAPGQWLPQELQTHFLTGLLSQTVTGYRVNGIKLTGMLRQFDPFTLLVHGADGMEALIFKHAISTLLLGMPAMTLERRTPFGKRPEWIG